MSGMTDAQKLADEYRPSMTLEVLHSWAEEVVSQLRGEAQVEQQAVAWSEMLSSIGMAKMSLMKDEPDAEQALRMLGKVSDSLDTILSTRPQFAAPAPVAGDAVAKLPEVWRRRATQEDEDGELYVEQIDAARLNICSDELEAALAQDLATNKGS